MRESSNAISLSVKNTPVTNTCIINGGTCDGHPLGCTEGCTVGNIPYHSRIKIVIACIYHLGKPHQVTKGLDLVVTVLCKHRRNPVAANRTVVDIVGAMGSHITATTAANGAIGFIFATGDFKLMRTLRDFAIGVSTSVANRSCVAGSSAALVVTGIICIVGVIYNTAFIKICIYFGAIKRGTCIYAKLLTHAEFKCKTSVCKLGFGNGEASVLVTGTQRIAANGVVVRVSAAVAKRVTDNATNKISTCDRAVVDIIGKRAVILIARDATKVCASADVNIALVYTVFDSTLINLTGNAAHTANGGRGDNVAVVCAVLDCTRGVTGNTAELREVKSKIGVYHKELNVTFVGRIFDRAARVVANDAAHSCRGCDGGIDVVAVLNGTAKVLTENGSCVGAGCEIRVFNSYVANDTAGTKLGNQTRVARIRPVIEVIQTGNAVSLTVKGTCVGNKMINAGFVIHNHTDGSPETVSLGFAAKTRKVTCIKGNVCGELCVCRAIALPYKVREPHQLSCVANLVISVNIHRFFGIIFISTESAKTVLVESRM